MSHNFRWQLFLQVLLTSLGSRAQGSRAGTAVELWENSFQTSLYRSFCLLVVEESEKVRCRESKKERRNQRASMSNGGSSRIYEFALSPSLIHRMGKKRGNFLRAQKIAITVRILKRRGARLHLLCSWGSKPCLRYSEVWKLSSQSSTDVPALLPSAMLTR